MEFTCNYNVTHTLYLVDDTNKEIEEVQRQRKSPIWCVRLSARQLPAHGRYLHHLSMEAPSGRLYAMERGLKIPQNKCTKTTNSLLISLMKLLEKLEQKQKYAA
ncbi:uncharacterized protein LOC121048979 [Rosa chinensis]|uniref:uncharacterized protein LOC121048979 n=1 Tax=Rosa chinensis TaxID=74649 RepID=UPI001AD90372|nr:uncharacterized protein LOC121048979 [Rosa chinensis]XP_040361287.1 uncharacterized protein LOC121048979 [Rosa chinensis]